MQAIINTVLPFVSTFDTVFWINIAAAVGGFALVYIFLRSLLIEPLLKAIDGCKKSRNYLVCAGVVVFIVAIAASVASFYYSVEGTVTALVVTSVFQLLVSKKLHPHMHDRGYKIAAAVSTKRFAA